MRYLKPKILKLFSVLTALTLIFLILLPTFVYAVNEEASITTSLIDGELQRGSKKTFDVWARNSEGEKISSSVNFNGKNIEPTWDDTDKTSYTLSFSKEGENTVAVSAGGQSVTYTIIYQKAEVGEKIGTAVWSVELFTIGCGYLIAPVRTDIYEGENAADALLRLINENGYTAYYGGEPKASFYLAYISDGDKINEKYNGYAMSGLPKKPKKLELEPNIPEALKPHLEETMSFYDENDYTKNWEGYIGEFVFTNGSGWMYSVNNIFPNVGFADTYLSDGDVVRVQFTLGYGADIGGTSAMGTADASIPDKGYFEVANKDRLTSLLADIDMTKIKNEYSEAVQKVDISQDEINAACEMLLSELSVKDEKNKKSKRIAIIISALVLSLCIAAGVYIFKRRSNKNEK